MPAVAKATWTEQIGNPWAGKGDGGGVIYEESAGAGRNISQVAKAGCVRLDLYLREATTVKEASS